MSLKIGFIGLGAMGMGMARNLHKAGLLSGVWNRTHSKAQSLAPVSYTHLTLPTIYSV